MEILIGLGLFVALLYVWLSGHWFGRVLAFLAFWAVFVVIGAVMSGIGRDPSGLILVGLLAGPVVSWFLAAAPTRYWDHKINQMLRG